MLTLKAAEMFYETKSYIEHIEISHINKHIDKLKFLLVDVWTCSTQTFLLIYSTVQKSWTKFHFFICQENWKQVF